MSVACINIDKNETINKNEKNEKNKKNEKMNVDFRA